MLYSVCYHEATREANHCSGRYEIDLYADTCVAGSNCVVLEYTGRSAEVEAYTPNFPSKQIPIATAAPSYDRPTTVTTSVLVINEALYSGDKLPFSLLSLNQIRDNDIYVDERHRQNHAPESIFFIFIPSTPLRIPFDFDGVVANFDTRQPTASELDDIDNHFDLTSDVEWLPHTFALSFVEEDERIDTNDIGKINVLRTRRLKVWASRSAKRQIISCGQILAAIRFVFEIRIASEVDASNQTDPVLRRIAALTTDAEGGERVAAAIRTGDVTSEVTPENVAQRWMVGTETVKKS